MIPGSVKLSVTGGQCQRFLNLCRSRNIRLVKICRVEEEELNLWISAEDFFKLAPLRRKTGVHIHILKKTGPLFIFLACRRHKSIPAGILLVICLLFFLSGRIWNVEIHGNTLNPTPQLMDFLEKKGVSWGMSKKSISCTGLAEAVRREFPDITWVSAGFSGTSLKLEIREGSLNTQEPEKEVSCDLVSTAEGTVYAMVTRKGTPLVKVGEEVKKGQELVSGVIPVTDDSQEVVRYEYVRADADIFIRHKISYYDSFPRTVSEKIFHGKEKRSFFLRAGNFFLDLSPGKKKKAIRLTSEAFLVPGENFRLPFSFGMIRTRAYTTEKKTRTEKEAKKQAIQRLYIYEEKLMEKGVQISENNVKIEINHQDCVSHGTFTVLEKAVREVPTEKRTQPKERTPEDG